MTDPEFASPLLRNIAEAAAEQEGPPPAHLDDGFYAQRPRLQAISDACHDQMTPRDSTLLATLTRVLAFTGPAVVLPPTVGGYASLNFVTALVGPSGAGKSDSIKMARQLVPTPRNYRFKEIGEGSGEGIAAAFVLDEVDGEPVFYQSVTQVVPEGEILTKVKERRGTTFMQVLRKAWSGEQLGEANAVAKRPTIQEMTYRYTAVIGLQLATAAPFLSDAEGGTPQRLVWGQATDPTIPGEDEVDDEVDFEYEPVTLDWAPRDWSMGPDSKFRYLPSGKQVRVMAIPGSVRGEIRRARRRRARGDEVVDPLDGQRLLVQLKVAAAFAIFDDRWDLNLTDWSLAEEVMAVSDAVRSIVLDVVTLENRQKDLHNREVHADLAVAAVEAVESHRRDQQSRWVAQVIDKLTTKGPLTARELSKCFGHKYRPPLPDTTDAAVAAGLISGEGTPTSPWCAT